MHGLRAIILAAGKGTRMKSLRPKVLHEVCGRPIISYVMDIASAVGSLKTYVVVGHQADVVKDFLGSNIAVVEQKRLLGTADAVRCTEGLLKGYRGDVLLLCGDTPLLDKAVVKRLVRRHKARSAVCSLLTCFVDNPTGYGRIIRNSSGNIIAIREEKDASSEEKKVNEINVGVYCVNAPELFKALSCVEINKKKKEFYLTDIIAMFASKGLKVQTVETSDPVEGLGINTREDLASAERLMRYRILRHFMLGGVTIVDPLTTYIAADVKIGQDTVIRPFTFIENNVKVGRNCIIGPFCRLRPGTRIGNDVSIGNFTEVSRTKIADMTKMMHFSYLGDSIVGAGVNIGAGTITANYDGKNKNVTQICNGAFIGCDSILIAPVKIGKNAVTGAGSVVTRGKDVPAGSVAVGVPAKVVGKRKY